MTSILSIVLQLNARILKKALCCHAMSQERKLHIIQTYHFHFFPKSRLQIKTFGLKMFHSHSAKNSLLDMSGSRFVINE